jgi:hypothetical protein
VLVVNINLLEFMAEAAVAVSVMVRLVQERMVQVVVVLAH